MTKSIFERVNQGESLLRLFEVPILKKLHRATVWRWAKAGKIPSVRLGRDFFTTARAVEEFLAAKNQTPAEIQAGINASHQEAVEKLRARGLVGSAKK